LYVNVGLSGLGPGDPPLYTDPFFILLIIAGLAYFPIAVIVAAISESFLAVLDPRIGVRIISRIPDQYVGATLLALGLLVVGQIFLVVAAAAVSWLPIPVFPTLLVETIGTAFWLAAGWVLGRLLYQNHEHFGLMLQGDDLELEWPGAVPRAPKAPEGSQSSQPVQPAPVEGWTKDPGLSRAADTVSHVPENARIVEAPRRDMAPLEIDGWTDRTGPATAGRDQPPLLATSGLELEGTRYPEAGPIELDLDGEDALPIADAFPSADALPIVDALSETFERADLPSDRDSSSSPTSTPGRAESSDPLHLSFASDLALDAGMTAASGAGAASGPYSKVPTPSVTTDALIGVPIVAGTPDLGPDGRATVVGPAPPNPVARPKAAGRDKGASSIVAPKVEGRPIAAPAHEALEAALHQQPGLAALTAYAACQEQNIPIRLSARLELRLANLLERTREFKAAIAACRRAADQDLGGPFAPRAIFMAAQIHHRELNDLRRASALYRYIIESYPADALAAQSDEALRRIAR
ncbi:MAG: hypothetical protein AAF449_05750, partial [Myxococcota bacterium]